MHVQTPRFGVHVGGSQACQQRVCALPRDAAARGHNGRACGGRLRAPLEQVGHRVGEIVHGGTRQSLLLQHADGFVQSAAPVFEGSGRAAHDGDAASAQLGERVARPGGGYRHRETPHLLQAGGGLRAVMVMGVERQDGHDLAGAQGHAHIDPPDQPSGKRRLAQGEALHQPGRLDADDRKSRHPIDDCLRAWRFVETQGQSEEAEDTRDGATADASHSKQLQGYPDQVHLVLHGTSLALGRKLAQASPGLFACLSGAIALRFDPVQLLAPGAIVIGSLRRFVLPLISAVSDFGPLAHHPRARQDTPPQATGDPLGR